MKWRVRESIHKDKRVFQPQYEDTFTEKWVTMVYVTYDTLEEAKAFIDTMVNPDIPEYKYHDYSNS